MLFTLPYARTGILNYGRGERGFSTQRTLLKLKAIDILTERSSFMPLRAIRRLAAEDSLFSGFPCVRVSVRGHILIL